ncbi:winged helix-turn-helix domain-containing protein [Novosphingobium sp.]|uniref:winged helix-turn-helix domain-containing protein n=1 Tax=Novosphingobium sp. TaxID=1874826 RepID=UPI0038BD3987
MRPMAAIKLKIQVMCGDAIAFGPGKADLLEEIGRAGSISAAARTMGMSYRRAWLLVDVMNRCWTAPLVETSPGSAHGGGARISALGERILRAYRQLQADLTGVADAPGHIELADLLRPAPLDRQPDHTITPAG